MLRARGSSFLMLSIQSFFSLSRHTGHGQLGGHAPCVQLPWEEWLNGERFSAAAVLGGVRVAELELAAHQILLIVELGALQIDRAFHVHDDADAVDLVRLIVGPHLRIEVYSVAETEQPPPFTPRRSAALPNPCTSWRRLTSLMAFGVNVTIGVTEAVSSIERILPFTLPVRPLSRLAPRRLTLSSCSLPARP